MKRWLLVGLGLLACLAVCPTGARAQYVSLGVGGANPRGDFGDFFRSGFTVRGQAGLSLVLIDAHIQAGWSRFRAEENAPTDDAANLYHFGPGARFGLGLGWVGVNAFWFSGDGDDGMQIVPEIGIGFGPLEGVLDAAVTGDTKWLALRVNVRT
jgi:hypothetical protein